MTTSTNRANSTGMGYKANTITRGETFSVHHSKLVPLPGFNQRLRFRGIPELADRIQLNGFSKATPLIVKWNNVLDMFEVIHGERRYRAIQKLVEGGIDPGPIWCMPESRDTSPLQRLYDQLLTNTGEQFIPLEKGLLYLQMKEEHLAATGKELTATEIASHMGETKQAVSNALRVARDGSPALHKAIVADRISSTTADSIIKQAGTDHTAQDKLLDESLSEATRQGSSHVTPKHVAKPDPAATGFEETSTSTSDHVIPPVEDDEEQPGESPAESKVKDLGTSNSTATGSNAPADPGAYQRLTSAPSTNRDGSSGRGDGYVAPDKRIKKIEKLLDDVNPDKCVDDRRISFERLAAYLNGECSIKDLRRWLEGRE